VKRSGVRWGEQVWGEKGKKSRVGKRDVENIKGKGVHKGVRFDEEMEERGLCEK